MTLEITNKQTCASFFPPNIKVPPEETEKVISGLAKFVAKNGYSFENLTREKQKNNPKFSFLFTGEYKDYYYHCIGIEAANLGMNAAPEFRQQYPVASQPWAPPWVFPAQQPLCISGPRFPYQPSGPLSSSPQPWPSQSLNAPSMPLERAAPDSFHPPPWESAEKEKCREGDSPPPPPPPPDNGQPWESLQYPPQQQVPWDRPPPQWEQPLPLHNRPAWQPPAIPPWNPQPPPWQPQNQPANPWPGPLPPWQRPPQEQHPPPMDFHLLDLVLETMVDNVSFEENKHKIEQCTDWALENCGDNYLRTVELGNHFCHLVAKCCANNESFTKVISFTFVIEAILRAGVENHRTNLINSLLDSLASIFVSVRESYPLPLFQCLMQLIESWGKENLFNSETLSNLKKLIEKEPNENQFIAALPESVMTRSRIPYYELSAASMFDCLLTLRADKYAPILPSYLSGDFADLHRIPQRLYDTVSRFLESLDQMEGRNHEGWVPHTLEKHNASLDTTAWLSQITRPRARQSRRSRSYSSSRSRSRSSSRTYSQSPSRSYSRSHSRSRSRSASYSSSRSRSQSLSSRSRSRSYSRSPRRRRSLSREGSLDPEFPGLSHPDIERCPEKPLDGSNVGFQMLQKMGWSGVGKGIGAKGTGRAEPVPSAEVRNKANKFSGIGVVKAKEPDDDLFEQFRKSKSYTHRRDMDKRKQEVPVCYNCGSEKHFAKNCPGIARSYK